MARISKTLPVVPPQTAAKATPAAGKSSAPNAVSSFTAAAPVGASATQGGGTLRFEVNPSLREIQDYAQSRGWPQNGWTDLSVFGQDIVYSTDNWKTTRSLSSAQVPSPFVNGRILLPDVAPGTPVQFALHVYVASHAPSDLGGYRERGDLWLNNDGQNFTQIAS